MSGFSKTTVGGADFELLCTGEVKNYSANPANIAGENKVKHIKRKLIAQLESTIRELELHSDRTIAKIYIGKTYIQRKRKPGGGFRTVDPINHHTWKKNGISSRWHVHKHEDYGRDGLVVLGAITRETMPERCRGRVHQEDFALAMEQKLLHHYLLSHPDPRVVNDSFSTGQLTKDKCSAYAVYMAFRYEDKDDETFSEDEETAVEACNTLPLSLREAGESLSSPSPMDQAIQSGPSTSSPKRHLNRTATPPRPALTAVSYLDSQQQAREEASVPSPTGSQNTTPVTPSRPTPSPPPRKKLKLTSSLRTPSKSPPSTKNISTARSPREAEEAKLQPSTPTSSTNSAQEPSHISSPVKKKLSLSFEQRSTKRPSDSMTSQNSPSSKKKQSPPDTQRSPMSKQHAGIGNLKLTERTPGQSHQQPNLSQRQESILRPTASATSETACSPSKTVSVQAGEGLQLSSLAANKETMLDPSQTPPLSPGSSHTPPFQSPSTPENPPMVHSIGSTVTNICFNKSIHKLPSIEQNEEDVESESDFQNQSDGQSYIMRKFITSLPVAEPVVTKPAVIDLTTEDD